jgi:uncharacterized protein DUF2865
VVPHAPMAENYSSRRKPALFLTRLVFLLIVTAVVALPDESLAQVSEQCEALERELANYLASRSGNSRSVARIDDAIARQQEALNTTQRQAQDLGCERRGFLIFQPRRPPQCRLVESEMRKMEDNLSSLSRQRDTMMGRGRPDAVQTRLQQSLAQNQCGPQYRRFASRPGSRARIFGDPSGFVPGRPLNPLEGRRLLGDITSYRTLCVRTCDGFYFPISFSTLPSRFEEDAATCQSMSPISESELYVYPNPGGAVEEMTTTEGVPYGLLQNAWRFRREVVQGCSNNSTTIQLEALLAEQAERAVEEALVSGDQTADGGVVVPVRVTRNVNPIVSGELPLRDLDRINVTPIAERADAKSGQAPDEVIDKAHINSRFDLRADDRRKDFSQLANASGTKTVVEIDRNAEVGPGEDPSG